MASNGNHRDGLFLLPENHINLLHAIIEKEQKSMVTTPLSYVLCLYAGKYTVTRYAVTPYNALSSLLSFLHPSCPRSAHNTTRGWFRDDLSVALYQGSARTHGTHTHTEWQQSDNTPSSWHQTCCCKTLRRSGFAHLISEIQEIFSETESCQSPSIYLWSI